MTLEIMSKSSESLKFFDAYRDLIPDFPLFVESLGEPMPTHVRVNSLKGDPAWVAKRLAGRGIRVEKAVEGEEKFLLLPGVQNPGKLPEYAWGHIHPQAFTSCLASLVLKPEKESFVLDLCAAPGGKTAHLAEMMGNTGLVVANELYSKRRIPLGHTLARLGVVNALITGYQAQEFPLRYAFDRILADVPCSGEGRFRAWSEFSWYEIKGSKRLLQQLQMRIIVRAFDLLKTGGEMVYSTCTYDPAENESVVQFLLENREADLLPIGLQGRFEPGARSWKGEMYDQRMERAVRFYPHRVDSVGFFMARIGRGGGAGRSAQVPGGAFRDPQERL